MQPACALTHTRQSHQQLLPLVCDRRSHLGAADTVLSGPSVADCTPRNVAARARPTVGTESESRQPDRAGQSAAQAASPVVQQSGLPVHARHL